MQEYYTDSAINFLRSFGAPLYPNLLGKLNSSTLPISTLQIYRRRDFADFFKASSSAPIKYLRNEFYREDVSVELSQFNDMLRYGPGIHDRFFSIDIQEIERKVYFSGTENNLPPHGAFSCLFRSPSSATSPILVERGFRNAVNQQTGHNLISCEIPKQIWDRIESNDCTGVILDFWDVRANHSLLSNVTVSRSHILDRRHFNISINAIVHDFSIPTLCEWLMYHILLGVEHFYLFDINPKIWTIKNLPIEPFILANIVTIIHYPFVPVKEHDKPFPASYSHATGAVHPSSFNVGLLRFGPYNKFIGFQDLDEYFVPSIEKFSPLLMQRPTSNALLGFFNKLGCGESNVPGIMFDTLEMGCSAEVNSTSLISDCVTSGFLFRELKHSHGKLFVKPALVKFVSSPHRYHHFDVIWTQPTDGLFFHFNNFRYSDASRGENDQLKNLLPKLIERLNI